MLELREKCGICISTNENGTMSAVLTQDWYLIRQAPLTNASRIMRNEGYPFHDYRSSLMIRAEAEYNIPATVEQKSNARAAMVYA